MPGNLKRMIRDWLGSWPLVNRVFYRFYRYRDGLDEKALRGLIQQRGHSLDLRLGSGSAVPPELIKDLEFLLREARRRNLRADDPMRWALGLLGMARYGLGPASAESAAPAGGGPAAPGGPPMGLAEAIRNRRSVRKYTAEAVDAEDIVSAIDLAKWAPSSCNRQLWQAVLLQKKEDVEFISRYFSGTFHARAGLLILVVMNAGAYGDGEKHFAYLDGGAFIQNLLLVLHAKGYGACWLGFEGWDTAGRVFTTPEKRAALESRFGLSRDQVPVSLIAVGRPAAAPAAPPRQGIEQIVIRRP